MPEKKSPPPVQQTAIGNDNIQVVGSNNVITRITNFFTGDTEAQRAMRNRHAMLELVKNTWIKGVLEKSLYNEVLIELGMKEHHDAVDHPWDMQVQMPDKPNRTLPAGTSMMEVFDETNGAMLILGEPGSGKTTMLLELARDCIDRAQQDDTQSIPVVFNLSSWDGKQTINDWLINELRTKYNVHKKIAQSWVENNDLQLLLDGLDEVNLEKREECVKAINDFRQEHGLTMPIAVCSRVSDYEALSEKLNMEGAVLLQPLTPDQLDKYFEQAGSELDGAHHIVHSDETMQELLKQPLMLSIMTLAYQGVSAEDVVKQQDADTRTRRKRLFDTYVRQMFSRVARTKNELYTPEPTKKWLAWLSQKMVGYSQSIVLVEHLQPNWLSNKRLILFHRVVVGILSAIIVGLIGGISVGISGSLISGIDFESIYALNWSWEKAIQGWSAWMIIGIALGTIVGLSIGLGLGKEIKTVDTLRWSWKAAKTGLYKWIPRGLLIGITFSLLISLPTVLLSDFSTGLIVGLFFSLAFSTLFVIIGGPIMSIFLGLGGDQVDLNTKPGEKIKLSFRNAMLSFLYVGFSVTFIFELVLGTIVFLIFGKSVVSIFILSIAISTGVFVGLIYGLQNGGLAVIQNYMLRLIIARYSYLPWRLVPFLDYCVDRIFLRRVGGGYIFVHRLLMEHFAEMYTEIGK